MYDELQLNSFRDHYNKLQKVIHWNFVYNETVVHQLLECLKSLDRLALAVFTFDMTYVPFVQPVPPEYRDSTDLIFDLFLRIVSSINSKKVILIGTTEYNWFTNRPSGQLSHITQLEIQIKRRFLHLLENTLFSQDLISSLKTLHLGCRCLIWVRTDPKTCYIELPFLNLETLHLEILLLEILPLGRLSTDMIMIRQYLLYKFPKMESFFSDFKIMLKVDTKNETYLYEFSRYSFSVTKILQIQPENCLYQIHIKIQNLQKIYLYDLNFNIKIAVSLK